MSTLRNKVNLIGRIGQKPELQTVPGGYQLTRFFVATNERYKDKSGAWQEETQWHNITAWGKKAENIVRILDKGNEIALEGKLVNRQYETQGGEKRYSTEIELNEFMLLNKKSLNSNPKSTSL
ncbi:MAG: single-strand binding protein [Crocinitomicaceae bacterium]|jgi:single-strand DNA-binding protein|nr:single-strand binding protein [Crocinitomicaceae bacterium]